MKKSTIIIISVVIVASAIFFFRDNEVEAGKYDEFAQCIKDSGAKFYGSFQCIHCKRQKDMFGNSEKYLPYIECGPLGGPQNLACQQAKITAYPTWDFPDNERVQGALSFDVLSKHTNCPVPS